MGIIKCEERNFFYLRSTFSSSIEPPEPSTVVMPLLHVFRSREREEASWELATGGEEEDCRLISRNLEGFFAKLFEDICHAWRRCTDVNRFHASTGQLSLINSDAPGY